MRYWDREDDGKKKSPPQPVTDRTFDILGGEEGKPEGLVEALSATAHPADQSSWVSDNHGISRDVSDNNCTGADECSGMYRHTTNDRGIGAHGAPPF